MVIILLCTATLFNFSCKKDPKSDKLEVVEKVEDSTAVAVEEVVEEEKKPVVKKKKKPVKKDKQDGKKEYEKTGVFISIPGTGGATTSNTDAKKYIRDYERYISEYKKAVEAKDMDSFLKLNEASSNLTKQYNSLMTKLSGEDIENISKYMQVKTKQLNELSAQM